MSIVSRAVRDVLQQVEEPDGLAAKAYVLATRLDQLLDTCPFPEVAP